MQGGDLIELNFSSLEMMDRASKINKKNGVICLVIMFTPIVMVFKMSEATDFLFFSGDNSKMFVTVWAIYLSTHGRHY